MKTRLNNMFNSIKGNRRLLIAIVAILMVSVAAGTTYSLISPAATLEAQTEESQIEGTQTDGEQTEENQSSEESNDAVDETSQEGTESSDDASADVDNETVNDLTEEEQAEVDRVNGLIDALPTYAELEDKILEYDDAGDYEAMEAYCTEITKEIRKASNAYVALTEKQKAYITDYEKLQDLENFAQTQPMLDEIDSDTPTTVPATGTDPVTSTSEFVKLNIYDYYGSASASAAGKTNINYLWSSNSSKKYPGFQWNGGAYMTSSSYSRTRVDNIDLGNSMITDYTYGGTTSGISNGVSSNYQKIGQQGGAINKIIEGPTGYWANKPTGISVGNNVMYSTLKNGYPALADGTSLNYLFSESNYAFKMNSSNIDGLFRQNQTTGEYWFDSRENHAQYANNKFTLYNQVITPNFILYPFGNFLPLNKIDNSDETTQVSAIDYVVSAPDNGSSGYMQGNIEELKKNGIDATEQQLIDMLARYRDSLGSYNDLTSNRYNWTVEKALIEYFSNSSEFKNDYNYTELFNSDEMQKFLAKLYNIDFDVKKNFMFGMDMEMNFMQPKDGMTGNDTNQDGQPDYPMEFYFAGDDDVWVYIDDILFLDLTGIHRHVGGDIDFVNGKVNYYMMKSYIDGQVQSEPYKTMTFAEILTDIGGVAEADLGNYLKKDANGNYTTFKDYTTHKFNFYYMERGTGSSVCCINFNFPMLRQNSISVQKDVTSDSETLGNPDFKFQVLKANSNGSKTNELFIAKNTTYNIYDEKNNVVGTGTTDANGVFTLKKGQRAEFTGIKENAGKYYVRELFDPEFVEQYESITVSGEATTNAGNVTLGSETFSGVDSPVKNASDGATVFRFDNKIDEFKLGGLKIKKILKAHDIERATFDFNVTLDGEPVAVGTGYTVSKADGTNVNKKVTSEGIITIGPGETAFINKIKAGTVFEVEETAASSEGCVVIYKGDLTGNDPATGVIVPNLTDSASDDAVLVKVTNTNGTKINVPVSKIMNDPINGSEGEFMFKIEQIDEVTPAYTDEITVKAGEQSDFILAYDANTEPGTYHYKVTELTSSDVNIVDDPSEFIVEVTIDIDEDDALTAASKIYKVVDRENVEVQEISFTNTQLYSFNISKKVTGGSGEDDTEFEFELTLTDDKGEPLTGEYSCTGVLEKLTLDNQGKTEITLKHDESLTINGLPAGTIWTVVENGTNSDGYAASYEINVEGEIVRAEKGLTSNYMIEAGTTDNGVSYINEVCYMLPQTGGIGTKPFHIGGLILMAGAALILARKRIRNEG